MISFLRTFIFEIGSVLILPAVFGLDGIWGIGMRYGRKTEAKDFARRGIGLLITGLLLNVFRYVLPMLTIYALSGEKLYLNTFTFLFGVFSGHSSVSEEFSLAGSSFRKKG